MKPEGKAPGNYYYHRGIAKFELKDKEGACSDMIKAVEQGEKEAIEWIKQNCN